MTIPAADIDGCAILNLTTGICTIYLDRRASKEAVRHEHSHCNGWHHDWDPQRRRYSWHAMPEVLKYDFASKEAGN